MYSQVTKMNYIILFNISMNEEFKYQARSVYPCAAQALPDNQGIIEHSRRRKRSLS
jgi:hypothetical protein